MSTYIMLPKHPDEYRFNARGRNDWFNARRLHVARVSGGRVFVSATSERGRAPNFDPLFLDLSVEEAMKLAAALLDEIASGD
jgi:hypothetical protein